MQSAWNEEGTREQIVRNRRATVDEIAKQMNISIGSAYPGIQIMQNVLDCCKR
jgi:predicted transcriptional regulator